MSTREETNRSIESFILNKGDKYVYTDADLNFLLKYDKCQDAGLDEEKVFSKVWDRAYDMPQGIKMDKRFFGKVMVTHGGGGKAITTAPLGASFHTFNDDYFCHEVTKALTSGRKVENSMIYDFGSIAEFFYLGNTERLPMFDLVISHPPIRCQYAELDYDEVMAEFGKKNARVYYAVRSFEFLNRDGVLMVIVPREEYIQTHEQIVELLFHTQGPTFDFEVPTQAGDDFILKYQRL